MNVFSLRRLVADEPTPTLSRLDVLDGRTLPDPTPLDVLARAMPGIHAAHADLVAAGDRRQGAELRVRLAEKGGA